MTRGQLFVLIILLQACLVRVASADDVDKPSQDEDKKDYKWVYFAALPVYYFGVEIPFHESTHGLAVAMSSDYGRLEVKPYPHYDSEQGAFVFGSASFECVAVDGCADKRSLGKIYLAPYIAMSTLFVTSDVLLATEAVDPTSISGRTLYFAGMVAPWLDFTYNTIYPRDISDNAGIAESFGMRRSSVIAKGAIISAVGAWRIWSGYRRAFPRHRDAKIDEPNLVVVPMGGAGTAGLSLHMTF